MALEVASGLRRAARALLSALELEGSQPYRSSRCPVLAERRAKRPMRLAYADPPYPGRAHLYRNHPDFAGEVDHAALVERLQQFDGWALSTNSDTLAMVLALCPPQSQVAAWVRSDAVPFNPDGMGAVRSWEPVIYVPARAKRNAPDRVRDVLSCGVPKGDRKVFPGAKPALFAEWVFGLLVAEPGDSLDDLFPGSGAVTTAWDLWNRQPSLWAVNGQSSWTRTHPRTHHAAPFWLKDGPNVP